MLSAVNTSAQTFALFCNRLRRKPSVTFLKHAMATGLKAHKLRRYLRGTRGLSTDISSASDLLRWWHQYQAQRLNQTADGIRNGMLQDLFAVRRQLEMACLANEQAAAFGCEHHLAELTRIYDLLAQLSDRLDAPYLQDSLPLSLQHVVQPWQTQIPITLELPSFWHPEPVEHTRLLTLFTEDLLNQLATAELKPNDCLIQLTREPDSNAFHCQAAYTKPIASTVLEMTHSLNPFLKTFKLFTQGKYEHTAASNTLAWTLHWQA